MAEERAGQGVDSGSLVDETLDEHRETMQAVARVEQWLDRSPTVEGDWLEQIRDELPQLAATLRCHFSEEQQGPLYRTLPVSHPRFAERLRKLEAEHARIIRAVDDAVQRAKDLHDPQLYELRELNAQLQLLVATVRRHEAEENEIILEAHWDGVGTGD